MALPLNRDSSMGSNGTPSISSIINWKQVIAVIVGYAFVQIVTSINPDTADYSLFSLLILAGIAIIIIVNDRKLDEQRRNSIAIRQAEFLDHNIELLIEFEADLVRKRDNETVPNRRQVYEEIRNEVSIRLRDFRRTLQNLRNINVQ